MTRAKLDIVSSWSWTKPAGLVWKFVHQVAREATLDVHCRYQLPTPPLRRPLVRQRELLRGTGQGAEDWNGQAGKGGRLYQVQLKMPLFQALEAKKKLGESAKSLSSAQRKSKWDIQGVSSQLHLPNLMTNYLSSDVACWQWGLGGNCDISFWKFEQEKVAKQLVWILSLNLVTIKLL